MKSAIKSSLAILMAINFFKAVAAEAENLFPVGFDNFTPAAWIDLDSVQFKDTNSFSYSVKAQTPKGLLRLHGNFDCKNKRYFYSTDDFERPVVPGTANDAIGQIICRESASRELWGFNQDNESLWNASEPKLKPGFTNGNWISAGEGGTMYNDDIEVTGDLVLYAQFNNYDITDAFMSDANYQWVAFRCNTNFSSVFMKPVGAKKGFWSPPLPMSPNGTARAVKKAVCR